MKTYDCMYVCTYVCMYVCMYVGYVHAYTCKAAFAPEDVSANGSTHQMQHVANTAGTMAGRGVVFLFVWF